MCGWLIPGTIVTWFMAAEQQFLMIRLLIIALLIGLMTADLLSLFDRPSVRRISGLVGMVLVIGGLRFGLEYPVYVLDILFVLAAGVCFGMAALQRSAAEEPVERPVPTRIPVRIAEHGGLFVRLQQHHPRKARLLPTAYASDIKDDSHRLTVTMPRL